MVVPVVWSASMPSLLNSIMIDLLGGEGSAHDLFSNGEIEIMITLGAHAQQG